MDKTSSFIKLTHLALDQKLWGFLTRLFGFYNFSTEKIGLAQFEVKFVTALSNENIIQAVDLYKNQKCVQSLKIHQDLVQPERPKTLSFETSKDKKFHFFYFCILFKFLYQHIKNNTKYENLILKTSRYKSYMFVKLFGFSMIGTDRKNFYLNFNTNESLQNIWEEFYASNLEENLYNFVLPVDAGGYVPGNIELQKKHVNLRDFQKTEKRLCHNQQPRAEIKIGYDLFPISIRDLSEGGVAFMTHTTDDQPLPPHIKINHIYSVWVNDNQLNMNWSNLIVQILWQKENHFGCKILENSSTWNQFILSMQIGQHERLTFVDKYLH